MVARAESIAGTGSTSFLPEGRFRRSATTCWQASGAGAVVALTRGRNAATIDGDLPAASKHLARQRIWKIPAPRTENVPVRFAATSSVA